MEQRFSGIVIIPFLLLLLTTGVSRAQLPLSPMGARAAAMGNITAVDTTVWAVHNNAAGLGWHSGLRIGISHEQRFAMPEMGVNALVVAFPLLGNGVGVSLSHLGYAGFGENSFGLAAGRRINDYLSAGVGVDVHRLYFPEAYRDLFAVCGKTGVWAQPAEWLVLGITIFNLTFSTWNDRERSPLPVVFALGAGYRVAGQVGLYAELAKDVYEPLRIKCGAEFSIRQALFLRAGVISQPLEPHAGLGYVSGIFRFEAALSRHPLLGNTPSAAISIVL